MSKQFDKQKKQIGKTVASFKSAPDMFVPGVGNVKRESAFVRDRIRRDINRGYGEEQRKENMKKGGNPLSVIANEETPNPARRDKLMKLAKYNKDRGR